MTTSGEREYRETHPWINFQLDLRRADPRLWILLGQIVAFGEFVSRAPLPPKVASTLARIYLARGVQATVAIEGNTLSEEALCRPGALRRITGAVPGGDPCSSPDRLA